MDPAKVRVRNMEEEMKRLRDENRNLRASLGRANVSTEDVLAAARDIPLSAEEQADLLDRVDLIELDDELEDRTDSWLYVPVSNPPTPTQKGISVESWLSSDMARSRLTNVRDRLLTAIQKEQSKKRKTLPQPKRQPSATSARQRLQFAKKPHRLSVDGSPNPSPKAPRKLLNRTPEGPKSLIIEDRTPCPSVRKHTHNPNAVPRKLYVKEEEYVPVRKVETAHDEDQHLSDDWQDGCY